MIRTSGDIDIDHDETQEGKSNASSQQSIYELGIELKAKARAYRG